MKTSKTIGTKILDILMPLSIFVLSIFLISCGSMVFIMTLSPFTGWLGPKDFGGWGWYLMSYLLYATLGWGCFIALRFFVRKINQRKKQEKAEAQCPEEIAEMVCPTDQPAVQSAPEPKREELPQVKSPAEEQPVILPDEPAVIPEPQSKPAPDKPKSKTREKPKVQFYHGKVEYILTQEKDGVRLVHRHKDRFDPAPDINETLPADYFKTNSLETFCTWVESLCPAVQQKLDVGTISKKLLEAKIITSTFVAPKTGIFTEHRKVLWQKGSPIRGSSLTQVSIYQKDDEWYYEVSLYSEDMGTQASEGLIPEYIIHYGVIILGELFQFVADRHDWIHFSREDLDSKQFLRLPCEPLPEQELKYWDLEALREAFPDQFVDEQYLEETTFIYHMNRATRDGWYMDSVSLYARPYGWADMLDWADYLAEAELLNVDQVTVGSMGEQERDMTADWKAFGGKFADMPELQVERGHMTIAGISKTLRTPVKFLWINQTNKMRIFSLIPDEVTAYRYAETVIMRSFGTEKAMKLGQPHGRNPQVVSTEPVRFDGCRININTTNFYHWQKRNSGVPQYEIRAALPLAEKEPVLKLYEDGRLTREYRLETEEEEDFTGKFFHISVRLGVNRKKEIPTAQIDGYISDDEHQEKMKSGDIGYRMEGHFLACGGEAAQAAYRQRKGLDLVPKGLKYPGYTTPSSVRLVGICPECGKSFCFRGYAFYMMQYEVAYSDDGLNCCAISGHNIDKETWKYEEDGKTFRYYNSFNCPHCGTPYIDYKTIPEQKVFGVSGCVLLGRKHYKAD